MEHYADATGHAPAFPYWASGLWQCKLRYSTQEEFLNVAREFKQRGLPLSVLVNDYLHWDIIGNWKLDPKYWPNPKAMVQGSNTQLPTSEGQRSRAGFRERGLVSMGFRLEGPG